MDWMRQKRSKRKKLLLALAVGMAGALAMNAVPKKEEQRPVTVWWGTLYPKFCFAEIPENTDENIDKKTADIKISFWLARVLDW